MDPDVEFTPGHSYINEDNTYPRPYLILAKNEGAVAFFVPTKKESGISTFAFTKPLDREWKHSSDCSCREHRNG
jgi:hypothetical protein